MKGFLPVSGQLRTQLLWLTLIAFLPAGGLVLYGNLEQQKLEKEAMRNQAIATARLVASSQEHYLKNARHLLGTIAEIGWLMTTTNRLAVDVHLRNLRVLSPDYADFGLLEKDGTLFSCAADTNATGSLTNASIFTKCAKETRFCVSEFEDDSLSKTQTLRFAFPVLDQQGKLHRILYGSLRLGLLSDVLTNTPAPLGSTITVLDASANVLGRFPDPQRWVGKNVRGEEFAQRLFEKTEEVTFETRGLDGVERLFATTTVSDGKRPTFFVAVGIPTALLYQHANQKLIRNSLALVAVAIFALGAAWFVAREYLLRPVDKITSAAQRLAAGDGSARAGLGDGNSELQQLARNFDSMAETLTRRQAELSAANEKISRLNAELEVRVIERTKQLEATNRELEAFSYSVSHDLRAPLRHMDGFAQILMTEPSVEKDERAQRYLQMITKAARQMGMLIDDLLSFSRMGRQSMKRQRVDFESLIRDVINEFKSDQEGRMVKWTIHPLPHVEGDAAMLRQVWTNLISNALKYTRQREVATIEIAAREEPEDFVFYIKDNGAGFDMKYADKLFGVFQRLHKPEEFEGTGIGLANVQRIVARHFGKTWAEAEVDKGATIFFSLPKPKRSRPAPSPESEGSNQPSKRS